MAVAAVPVNSASVTPTKSYPLQQTRGRFLLIGEGNAKITLSIYSFNGFCMSSMVAQEGMITPRQSVLGRQLGDILPGMLNPLVRIIAEYAVSHFFDIEESSSLKDYVQSDLTRRGMQMPRLNHVRRIAALVPTANDDVGFNLQFKTEERAFLTYRESFLVSPSLQPPRHTIQVGQVAQNNDRTSETFIGKCDHYPIRDSNILLLPLNASKTQVDEVNASYIEVMPDNGAVGDSLAYESGGCWYLKDTKVWESEGNKETNDTLEYRSRIHQYFNSARFFLYCIRERHIQQMIANKIHPSIIESIRAEMAADAQAVATPPAGYRKSLEELVSEHAKAKP